MAGAGFKTFSNGEVLTASDVNTYMMEQQIMVFANENERDTTILSPSEGMFAYSRETNILSFYNGVSWRRF
jgi:hypothetical protein